ncbi:MAG: substrate-binding domain-containing protein [Bryobacterales bacterium]|nr:substrate-binding domain-containing protein [Bryobacterales bacterium]
MKRSFSFSRAGSGVLLGAALLALTSCGGGPSHDPSEFYYLITTNKQLPYWQEAQAGFQKAARELGVRAEMVGPDTYDPQAERDEFRRIMAKKPTGILISVANPSVIQPEIDAAIAAGVPVMTVDSDSPGKRLLFVGTDNYRAGLMGGERAAELLGGKGTVVVYTMPEQQNLRDRLSGYKEIFDARGIKIAEVVDIKGDPTVAFDRSMEIVDKIKPDGFICLEAVACAEVADVLGRKNVTGKVVVAMDTDQRTLELIEKGVISATIAQKPYTMAFFGLKVLADLHLHPLPSLDKKWAEDSFSPLPVFIDTGVVLVDKNNVSSFLNARDSATGK